MKNSVGGIIRGVVSLLLLVVLVSLVNFLPIDNFYFVKIVEFVNSNLLTIILFTILFFLGEAFYLFGFPVNLPAPIFRAYASYFLAGFVFATLYLIDNLTGKEIFAVLEKTESVALTLIFILVLIFGILRILARNGGKKSDEGKEVSWEDIGGEFKRGMYNLATAFRQSLEPKDKKDAKKKSKVKVGK